MAGKLLQLNAECYNRLKLNGLITGDTFTGFGDGHDVTVKATNEHQLPEGVYMILKDSE